MDAPRPGRRYTPEEYLAYERQSPSKHEYIDGQIRAMGDAPDDDNLAGLVVAVGGTTHVHNRITMNLARMLSTQTLDGLCETYGSDQRVKVEAAGVYVYPDLTVVCGEQQFEDTQEDTLLNPTLIIEVHSPATEAYDRGKKFGYYQDLPSVQEYVLVAQNTMLVENFVRAGRSWVLIATTDSAAVVRLPAIGCDLPMAVVYRKVVFPASAETSGPSETGDQQAP